MKLLYTAWFRDAGLMPDDQDYEWPACFIVEAPDAHQAGKWGDHLASRYARSRKQIFLSSSVEALEDVAPEGVEELPVISYGYEANDDEIGW